MTNGFEDRKGRWMCCCGCLGFWLIVGSILLIISFGYLDFNEIGLARGEYAGIDYSTLYGPGRHFIWPSYSFVKFKTSVQFLDLSDLEVFSKDDGSGNTAGGIAGTPLDLTLEIQYALNKDTVVELFQKYNQGYPSVLRNLAIETIKNNATLFSADEYLTIRRTIEDTFLTVITAELKEVGLVDVLGLQLKEVDFPASFYQRKLDAGIQVQLNLIETFLQNTTVIREETANLVAFINNDGETELAAAKAKASLIRTQGNNNATKIRADAQVTGLVGLNDALGITAQSEKLSLNYLLNIRDSKKADAFVNFNEFGSKKEL